MTKRPRAVALVVLVLLSAIAGLPAAPPASALVGDITAFRDPTGEYPVGFNLITTGSDGNLWFTTGSLRTDGGTGCDERARNALGRITPGGQMTFFEDPEIECPTSLTLGPDGNVWFVFSTGFNQGFDIGYITPEGDITTFDDIAARTLSVGPDGNLWYIGSSGPDGPSLVRMDTAGQVLDDFPAAEGQLLGELVLGPDDNFWYVTTTGCGAQGALVRQTPSGIATTFCDPNGAVGPAHPSFGAALAPGPNETIWFTSADEGQVGIALIDTLDPDPASTIRQVARVTGGASSIAEAQDGNMWLVATNDSGVRRVSPQGVVSVFRAGSGDLASGRDITVGSNGDLWYTAFGPPGGIGRVSMGAPGCNTAPPPAPVIDVPDTAWYGDAVDWGTCHGFLRTIGDDRFAPTKVMKRGQLVQTLWEMVDRPGATPGFNSPDPHGFTDVGTDAWFNDALDWAEGREMFTTLPGGEFRQHRELRRGEFAYVLWRMAGSPPASEPSGYVDVPPSAWYAPAVDWAAEHGLTVTASTTRLHPKKTVKRAQAIDAIHRLASDPTAWADWDGGTVSTWRFDDS